MSDRERALLKSPGIMGDPEGCGPLPWGLQDPATTRRPNIHGTE
jgi:hypothetical protein